MRTRQLIGIGCGIAGVLTASGCTIGLKHDPLNTPARTYNESIQTARSSTGIDGKVGWGRGTAFYIPFVPIYITGAKDDNEQVADQIRDALHQVGYNVTIVDSSISPNGPVLECKVKHFWFNNYTWLFPIVPTWGSVDLELTLRSSRGPAWQRTFSGSGSTLNFFNGYTSAADQAMTKILNEMVEAFAGEEFRKALLQT